MAEIETGEERQSIVTSRLRLAFQWTGDRWAHVLEREDTPERFRLAASVEGGPERDGPARVVSPAYQQLGFQRRESVTQALLVGQSGRHHDSAVFTVSETAGEVRLQVDVADRSRADSTPLACTYWVNAVSGDLLGADPEAIAWEFPPHGRLVLESGGTSRLALAEGGRNATQVQVYAPSAPGTPTQCCLYRWRWLSP